MYRRNRLRLGGRVPRRYNPGPIARRMARQRNSERYRNRGIGKLNKPRPEEHLLYNRLEKLFQGRPRVLEIRFDFLNQKLKIVEYQIRKTKPYGVKSVFRALTKDDAVKFIIDSRHSSFRFPDRGYVPVAEKKYFAENRSIETVLGFTSQNPHFDFTSLSKTETYFLYLEERSQYPEGKKKSIKTARIIIAKKVEWLEVVIKRNPVRFARYWKLLPEKLRIRAKKKLRFTISKRKKLSQRK